MQISDILTEDLVVLPLKGNTKREVIENLVECLVKAGKINDKSLAISSVLEREKIMSTGIGKGVAIPHGKYPDIEDVVFCIGVVPEGVDFASLDEQPAYIIALLLTPNDEPTKHIKLLSKISRLLNNAACRSEIISAGSPEEIVEILKLYESKE